MEKTSSLVRFFPDALSSTLYIVCRVKNSNMKTTNWENKIYLLKVWSRRCSIYYICITERMHAHRYCPASAWAHRFCWVGRIHIVHGAKCRRRKKSYHYWKSLECRVPRSLPCAFYRAHGKEPLCRVPQQKCTAKKYTR